MTSLVSGPLTGHFEPTLSPIAPKKLSHPYSRLHPLTTPSAEAQIERKAVPLEAHILLTGDNPINREVTLGMANLLGCTVTRTDNGCEALDAASQTAFDLILMDCQMPEVDSFTAATAIRRQETDAAEGRHVPIIVLKANAMEGARARCLAAGMDNYLAKPFTLFQLKAVLTQWPTPRQTAAADADPTTARQAALVTSPASAPLKPVAEGVDKTAWTDIQTLQRPAHPDILARVLTRYLEDSRQLVEQIRSVVQGHGPVTLHQAAHRLKSSSAQRDALATGVPLQRLGDPGPPGPAGAGGGAAGTTHSGSCRSLCGDEQGIAGPRRTLIHPAFPNTPRLAVGCP